MNATRTVRTRNCPTCGRDEAIVLEVVVDDYAEITAVECGCELTAEQRKEIEARVLEDEPDALEGDYIDYLERRYDV